MRILAIMMLCFMVSGCAGTLYTRTGNNGYGRYPYQAIAVDCYEFPASTIRNPSESAGSVTAAIIFSVLSIPLDLVIDTVMLPVDLVAWPLGKKKGVHPYLAGNWE